MGGELEMRGELKRFNKNAISNPLLLLRALR